MYRDKCDICHRFKICKGYDEMILCEECINEIEQFKNNQNTDIQDSKDIETDDLRTTIFDFCKEGE